MKRPGFSSKGGPPPNARRTPPALVALGIAVAATAAGLLLAPALWPLDAKLYDSGLLARASSPGEDVIVVGIDEEFMAGRHAYLAPRDRLAQLLRHLTDAKPAAIGVDVWLDSRMPGGAVDVDAELHAALSRAAHAEVPVVLADIPAPAGGAESGGHPGTYEGGGHNKDHRPQGQSGQTAHGTTLPYFAFAAAGTGSVVFTADADGIMRHLPPPGPLPFLPAELVHLVTAPGAHKPRPGGPPAYPAGKPLPFLGPPGSGSTLKAADILSQPMLASLTAGRIVLVGATYPRSADYLDTPYSTRGNTRPFYGVEVLAQCTQVLLDQAKAERAGNAPPLPPASPHKPGRAPGTGRAELLLGLALAYAVALLARRGVWQPLALTLAAMVFLSVGAVAQAQAPVGTWAALLGGPRVYPAAFFWLALPLAAAMGIARRQLEQARELRLVRETFGAYVGSEVLEQLGGQLPELGGEIRPIAVLFCDIRGYSALAESMQDDPRGLMNELNAHFQPLVGALKQRGAYVDNYVGDLVMALFNAPVAIGGLEQAAEAAVAAAKDFVELVQQRNAARVAQGKPPIEIGVGVHCGDAVVGNLGSLSPDGQSKIHYTAIGDTVNIASRVESATRGYGVPLLVTEEVTLAVPGQPWNFVAETQVKGRVAPVRLYQPGQ